MSSDSEDDCYGNIAKRLQNIKNQYPGDKSESSFNKSDLCTIDNVISEKNETKESNIETVADDISDEDILDKIIAANAPKEKRRGRAAKKKSNSTSENSVSKKKSKKNNEDETTQNLSARGRRLRSSTSNSNVSSGRGKSRRRAANISTDLPIPINSSRGRSRRIIPGISNDLPIFSVGNTEDYDDLSHNVQLFGNKQALNDIVVIDDANDPLDENEEISVKVYWLSCEIVKFTIRKFQKLTQLFDYFSHKENVSLENLLFTYQDKILKPSDTPNSIDYNIAKFIEGGIVNQSIINISKENSSNTSMGIKLKFQCQNHKKPFETNIEADEMLLLAMTKCAEHLEKPLKHLKFEFDGDLLNGKLTAQDLELEGGECIDVRII